ncbi:MAG: IS5/IS1182 family transposase, partial [Steroidobacteraceae bacterium]
MKQTTFSSLSWAGKKKTTRREGFLAEMDQVIPWKAFMQRIEPVYPKAGAGR